jgi:hypothetical protein
MSIPEVSSRSRLIAFLKKFFVYPDGSQPPRTSGPLSIATTDNIALSASTVSDAASLNTIKAIGKWPLQLHQNQADGYGLYIIRGNGADAETYPLTWMRETNASSTEPVLRVDQASEVTALFQGYGTTFELWTPGPNGSNSSLWVDNRGRLTMGGDQGLSQGNGTHMVDVKTTSYFDSVTFTGTGLDDLDKWSNGYTGLTGNGAVSYRVQIDATGTPDTFKWSTDNGSTWTATGVNCSTSVTSLQDGIYVKFGATTGHTIGDYWAVAVRVVNPLRIRDAAGNHFMRVHNDRTVEISGDLQLPNQPMVYAFRNSTQDLNPDTSWETVIFNDESTTNDTAFDVGGDYNTGTGVFTAPADGKYLISTEVMLTNAPASSGYILLNLITTKAVADGINQYSGRVNPGSWDAEMDYYQIAGTWLANMSSGDTAYINVSNTVADGDTKIYGASTTTYTRIQIMKVA